MHCMSKKTQYIWLHKDFQVTAIDTMYSRIQVHSKLRLVCSFLSIMMIWP